MKFYSEWPWTLCPWRRYLKTSGKNNATYPATSRSKKLYWLFHFITPKVIDEDTHWLSAHKAAFFYSCKQLTSCEQRPLPINFKSAIKWQLWAVQSFHLIITDHRWSTSAMDRGYPGLSGGGRYFFDSLCDWQVAGPVRLACRVRWCVSGYACAASRARLCAARKRLLCFYMKYLRSSWSGCGGHDWFPRLALFTAAFCLRSI